MSPPDQDLIAMRRERKPPEWTIVPRIPGPVFTVQRRRVYWAHANWQTKTIPSKMDGRLYAEAEAREICDRLNGETDD